MKTLFLELRVQDEIISYKSMGLKMVINESFKTVEKFKITILQEI